MCTAQSDLHLFVARDFKVCICIINAKKNFKVPHNINLYTYFEVDAFYAKEKNFKAWIRTHDI
jgi:hypothetical protein